MTHQDPHKMTPAALAACACERCHDALRLHAALDALIAAQNKTFETLDRLEKAVDQLGETFA